MREISKFCDLNNFELIWFCHDIEEVYLGRKIVTSQKVQEAGDFRRKNKIQSVSADRLSAQEKRACNSNILLVLDKYLERKIN